MKIISSILIVLVAVLGGWYLLANDERGELPNNEEVSSIADTKEITVVNTNLTETGSKLPAGFPESIPVEIANILESYRVVYNERGVTQYTVSYTSVKSRDSLWDAYNSYMKGNGFTVDTSISTKSGGQISGTNTAGDTLFVVLSVRSGSTLVQISLLDRN